MVAREVVTVEGFESNRRVVWTNVAFLTERRYSVLPVAPRQDPYQYPRVVKADPKRGTGEHCPFNSEALREGRFKPDPKITGKNPSYLDSRGKPHLINHHLYQDRLPTESEHKQWFANPANGVGVLCGRGLYAIDLDRKHFNSQEECDRVKDQIIRKISESGEVWVERTHSGGYRIMISLKQEPGFTNFALEPGGQHVGEVLGKDRFAILAPTIGPSGNPYVTLNLAEPVEVESLEAISIFPTGKPKSPVSVARPKPVQPVAPIPGSIPLEILGNDESRRILKGEDTKGDRSASLVTAFQEWCGVENWCRDKVVPYQGSAEELARWAGEQLGIPADRVERIIFGKTVDPASCQPAAVLKGGDEAYWLKIKRLDKATYLAKCPQSIQEKPQSTLATGNVWGCLDSRNHELGEWREIKDGKDSRSIFVPVANFDFSVERVLESDDGGGLVLQVEQMIGGQLTKSRVIIPSTATTKVVDFVNALKKGLKRNVCCTLKQEDLQRLLHVRTKEYWDNGGRSYRLIDRVGQQPDGTWVFEDRQLTKDGQPITEEKSGWVWNPMLGEVEKVPSPKIAAPDPEALSKLVKAVQNVFPDEILPLVWLSCGFATANLQRLQVMQAEGKFPQLSNYGDAGGGKTTAVQVAMSLIGLQDKPIQRFSESMVFEQAKLLSGLLLWLDDPVKKGMRQEEVDKVNNLLWSLYNAAARKVKGNEQEPHTAAILTSNVALGEGNSAVESRLLKLYFPVKELNKKGFQTLREAMKTASGGLGQLIAIGYPKAEIDNLESQIVEHLNSSHARISQNLALLTYYTQQFCDIAGVEFNALDYCLTNLCPAADDLGSDKDSLTDFLEKLAVLRSKNSIGEWNLTTVEDRHGCVFLALYGPGIWEEFAKQFSVNYSRQTVERLALERGATRKTAKFVDSKLTWTEYQRAKAMAQARGESEPPKPPKSATYKALLIPYEIVAPILDPDDDVTDQVTSNLPSNPASNSVQVTSKTHSQQAFQAEVTQVTCVTPIETWQPEKGSRVLDAATGWCGVVTDIEDGYFFTVKLDEPFTDEDGDTYRAITRSREQLRQPENLVEHYTSAIEAAAQQNGHSRIALAQLIHEMEPLTKTVKQGVWNALPKDLKARIQVEIIGKPLNHRTGEVA